ncbi:MULTISPECIES: heavy metal-responsive transcriptional regulator [unclassified Nitrospina]|uniref:heavy metal-responsive transcriptional regulator n=1 Tax=unclassified Nitrospina TaxID=2638683 RepID=UPI003F9B3AB5
MYTRSKLAQQCGINIEVLRYYEKKGLIEPPARSPSGYRLYTDDYIHRIQFIRNAKEVGFTLSEISELLRLRTTRTRQCRTVMTQAEKKLTEVDQKIQSLQSIKKALKGLISKCQKTVPSEECPILTSFDSGKRSRRNRME